MIAKLGDVCTVVSGSTPKSAVPEYWDGDIKWITPAELNEDTYVIYDSARHISALGVAKTGLKPFPAGTVILSSRAPIGKTAIAGCEMYCNQGFKNLVCGEKIDSKYLYFFLSSKTDYLNSLGRGATFKEISKAIVENVEIPLPELSEQRRIAACFEKLMHLIHLRKTELEEMDKLRKSRFIELFGSVEVNVFGFETIKIKDACDLINGKAFKPEDWSETGLPIVRIQNLNNDQAPFNFFNGEIKEQYLIDTGELLFSWSGTPGTSFGAFFWNRGKAVLNQHIFRVKPKIEFNLSFLQFALNGRIDHIISKAHGGVGLQHITKKELDEVELLLPAIELQNQFAAFVKQTDKSKLAIQQSLDKLELLKKSLMQEYFG